MGCTEGRENLRSLVIYWDPIESERVWFRVLENQTLGLSSKKKFLGITLVSENEYHISLLMTYFSSQLKFGYPVNLAQFGRHSKTHVFMEPSRFSRSWGPWKYFYFQLVKGDLQKSLFLALGPETTLHLFQYPRKSSIGWSEVGNTGGEPPIILASLGQTGEAE